MINIILANFVIMLSNLTINTTTDKTISLEDLKWKKRVIVIVTDSSSATDQVDLLNMEKSGINNRDISWFVIKTDTVISNETAILDQASQKKLIEYLKRNNDSVLLIGKDGGIKWSNNNLKLNAIFNLIDSMPMRIREMQTKD